MRDRFRRDLSTAMILVAILLVLLGCNFPGLKPTPDFEATIVVRTVAARQTGDASQMATEAAHTVIPGAPTSTASSTGTQVPAATSTPGPCEDRARFIIDVTIPDGTYLAGGTNFEKIWRLLNAGTCPWTTEYALVFDNGNSMNGDAVVPLTGRVVPGSTVDLAIDLTAPGNNGSYEGNWMLRNDKGMQFGLGIRGDKYFWVKINVGPTPAPTSTPTPIP